MKKFFALIMALAMMLSLAACGGKTDSDTKYNTVESGKLIMATNAEFPPYEMKATGEGVYTGADGVKF